ncbi:hypothetical protein LQG66_21055 [Bradyrhizobium ontarionense]|uniref:Transposase n=1 Tax=Bradyrhizobium ontarionense TaxID=2898149 RepID=A0ABY3R410_9BRAD|nr:hypothetical protein [Bradyrhizobium sp. A19]UFZ01802.1 hypothetical protein LQG66_21055 [Bradyrhizobium sp. A19]
MKRSELHHYDENYEDHRGFPGADFYLQERIALLLDENEKLRRIAADLTSQTQRMRRSSLGSN